MSASSPRPAATPATHPSSTMGRLGWGMSRPLVAARFVGEHPTLLPLCLGPVVVAGLLLTGLVVGASRFAAWASASVAGSHGIVAGVLYALIMLFVVFAVVYFGLVTMASLAASPFCGLLAERVESLVTGEPVVQQPLGVIVRESLRGAWHALLRSLTYLLLTLPLSLLALLSSLSVVLSFLAPVLVGAQFFITCWFLAYDFLDYPLSRPRGDRSEARPSPPDFAGKWSYVDRHRAESLGFGLVVGLLLLVPVLNLLVPPIAAVAATLMYVALGPPVPRASPPVARSAS